MRVDVCWCMNGLDKDGMHYLSWYHSIFISWNWELKQGRWEREKAHTNTPAHPHTNISKRLSENEKRKKKRLPFETLETWVENPTTTEQTKWKEIGKFNFLIVERKCFLHEMPERWRIHFVQRHESLRAKALKRINKTTYTHPI